MSASLKPQLEYFQADPRKTRREDWIVIIWFSSLLLVSYAVVLARTAKLWMEDLNMSHGIFVPVLVAYMIWQERDVLRAVKPSHNAYGLVLMLMGGSLLCMGPPGLDTFAIATRLAFMCSLTGTILYLRGFATIRLLLYPLLLLCMMFPLPGFVLERFTLPLQLIASRLAEQLLEWSGYSILRDGNILHLPGQTLSIAEACSGLRSLLALTFLAQAYAYMFDKRPWMRLALAVCVIPIAIFANSMRIVATAVAGSYRAEWAHGTYHEWTAWVVFAVAFLGIIAAHVLIGKTARMFSKRKPQCSTI
jgi:exosortase